MAAPPTRRPTIPPKDNTRGAQQEGHPQEGARPQFLLPLLLRLQDPILLLPLVLLRRLLKDILGRRRRVLP